MKMKPNYFVIGLGLLSFVVSVIAVFFLPDQVPIHWNFEGEIDNYGSKYVYLLLGSLGILTYFLMNLTRKIDPNEAKIDGNLSAYATMRNIISIMMSCIGFISILSALQKEFNTMLIFIILGGFFVVLGNYMPRVPHNYFMGAKTPWALADENNWKKTQRFSGYGLVIGGLLFVLAGLFNQKIFLVFAFMENLGVCMGIYIYSWYLYKRDRK